MTDMTPREEWDAKIEATLARSDRIIDRGIDDKGDYVPIEDDPTVPSWRELEAGLTVHAVDSIPTLTNVDVDAEIAAHYQPHRRNWRWVAALVGLIVCIVLFGIIAAHVINGANPAPVQTWSGEF